jgi:hypothetical protein
MNFQSEISESFSNELKQPINDIDVAFQLHNNRGYALHYVFDNQPNIEVYD